MSGQMHGAHAGELDRLAAQFDQTADQLDRETGALSGILNNVSWLGDSAGRFMSDWTGWQLPRIGLSTRFLRDTASALRVQANEQRHASAADGGSGRASSAASIGPRTPRQVLDERFADNEHRLRDHMATLDPHSDMYRAFEEALANGYKVYDFDPSRGFLTWATPNLTTATNVVVNVPGTGTNLVNLVAGENGLVPGAFIGTSGDTAVLMTLAWDPPPNIPANVGLDYYEQSLVAGPLGAYLEQLDGFGKNVVVAAHSAGGAAVQTLFERRPDLIQHVDGVALLAPAEIHAGFANRMAAKPVLYAIHSNDPIVAVHGDGHDLIGNVENRFRGSGSVVYRESGVAGALSLDAHDEWRYAENFRSEIGGLFPGSEDLGNGWHRQRYIDEDGQSRYVDVPEF